MVAGIRTAVEGMNKRGGVNGHKVNVVARDNTADNARGIANVREVIQQQKASAIIGVNVSAVAAAIIPVIQELQVPFVSSGIPSTKVTPALPYVYMYGADLSPQGIAQLKEVKQLSDTGKIPAKPRIAALHYATPAGQNWIKTVNENVASITGGSMVSIENFPVNVTDLGTQISKINAAKPDVVILFAAQNIMAIATQALRSVGVSPTLWMINYSYASDVDTFKTLNLANYLGLRAYKDSAAMANTPGGKNLIADSNAAGENPDQVQFIDGYAAALLVMDALRRCGYPCPGSKLITYLDQTNTDLGGIAYGPVKWTPDFHAGVTKVGFVRWNGTKLEAVGDPVVLFNV
jgi:branched-chain amino acid transport system substrate-binding protein